MAGANFALSCNNGQLISALAQSRASFGKLQQTAEESGVSIDQLAGKLNNFAALAGISFGTAGLASFAKKIYNVRSNMQDLESTMRVFLGSEEKAAKFTKELQDYAYWNMFEFTDLTEASTQLMAYGTATEELIPTIDKLSNIASGTKQPLEQYISLFNKAKSTGSVDSHGLESWARSGIVLKDELKKLGETVNGNSVSFEQLQKVLNHVTSDGERFGGLMMSQMDNLSASWGQLEDNFANMLNELGVKLQDVFKSGIDLAGTLIDNYEKIGKVLLTLVAVYGEYKAVLVATNALNSAKVLMEAVEAIKAMRTQVGLLKAVQQAFNITAMQNPYILAATAILMAATAIYGLTKALSDDRTEVEKLNDTYDERIRALQEEQRLAGEQIRTLQDETASTEALYIARLKLKELPAFEGYSEEKIALMNVEEIKKVLAEYDKLEKEKAAKESQLGKLKIVGDEQTKANNKVAKRLKNEANYQKELIGMSLGDLLQELSPLLEMADLKEADSSYVNFKLVGWGEVLNNEGLKSEIENAISIWEKERKEAEETANTLGQLRYRTDEQNNTLARSLVTYSRATNVLITYRNALKKVNYDINEGNKVYQGSTLQDIIKEIDEQEKVVAKLEKQFAAGTIEQKDLEKAKTALKGFTDTYALMTGKQWVDSKKMAEEQAKNIQALSNEAIKIKNAEIKDERKKRKAEFDQQIKELREEEAEYKRTHNGRGSGTLSQKIDIATQKYNLDIENLDKQWAEWKADKEKEKMHLELDIRLEQAKNELANALTVDGQIAARQKVRELEDRKAVQSNEDARDSELLAKLGGYREQLLKYRDALKNGTDIATALGIDMETANQLADINERYAELLRLQQRQTDIARVQEDFSAQLSRLEQYYSDIERIEQEHAQKMKELNDSGASKAEKDKENDIYQQRKKQAEKNITEDEKNLASRMTSFAQSIAGQTYEQIKAEYAKFLAILDNDIANLEKDIENYKTEEKNNQNAFTSTKSDLATIDMRLAAEGLTEQDKNDLLKERATIVQKIADIEARQSQNTAKRQQAEQQLTILQKGRRQAEQSALDAENNALTEKEKREIQFQKDLNATNESFGALKSTAQSVADTLGGALSENGKKALQGIMDIASIGQQSIQSIQSVSQAASIAISDTASAAEKASAILMAVSAIVQVVTATVKFFSQFTVTAKMQKGIDEMKERIEQLKQKHQDLEREYKNSKGTAYYKKMAVAAKDYNNIIAEQQDALQKAIELEEYQRRLHSDDSDKVKDAAEQTQELRDQLHEFEDAQKEMYDELAQELLTTDVKSFAENLVDEMMEAWEDGTRDMQDVWDNMLDNLQRDMMRKLATTVLTDMFSETFERIGQLAHDGELTQAEIDRAIAEIDSKSQDAIAYTEQVRQAMEQRGLLTDASVTADKGGLQSMSQDTADELNARFTALQMEGANVVAATAAMIDTLALMQANSDRSTLALQNIELYAINAQIAADEKMEIIKAIRENTDLIVINTNRLKNIEQNTNKL